MATDPFDAFVAEFETLIKATWSDIDATTLFTQDQAERNKAIDIILGRLVTTSNEALEAPFAVWLCGEAIPDTNFGIANIALRRTPVQVWRIEERSIRASSTNQRMLNNKAFDLATAVANATLSSTAGSFYEIEPAIIDSAAYNEANARINNAGYPWITSCVRWSPGLQVGTIS